MNKIMTALISASGYFFVNSDPDLTELFYNQLISGRKKASVGPQQPVKYFTKSGE